MSGRLPTEPTGPASTGDAFNPRWVLGWAVVTVAATVALAVFWFTGGSVELLSSLGAVAAGALAVILHHVVVTQDAGERDLPRPDTADTDLPMTVERRHVLGGAIGVGVVGIGGGLGLAAFGPRRPAGSAWEQGSPLVTVEGTRLRPEDIPVGGVVTVWPEGAAGTERAAVMLIRLREDPLEPTLIENAVVEDRLVAYSRLCTHAGCAVALYRDIDQALFCPCHQATFDARRAAQPTSGPASVPLPQLPIGLDGDGWLVATGDLTAPPGPVSGSA
jgi:ubiquinol-cytochrome c reductase iron-sulfur subunit